jgi:hypothetical protein
VETNIQKLVENGLHKDGPARPDNAHVCPMGSIS